MIKRLLISIAAVFAVLVLVGLVLPREYSAQRSTMVYAPVEHVFSQVNNLESYNAWSPWAQADQTMVITYGDKKEGLGASYSWTSKESGSGTLTIAKVVGNERIETELDFHEMGTAKGLWTFKPNGDAVEVTWGFVGNAGMNLFERYMGLMMDSLVGGDFERGLAGLKNAAETAA